MEYLVFALNVLLFLFISFLSARYFYFIGVRRQARAILQRLRMKESELHYSLDHMIYFIQTEGANPLVCAAGRDNLYVKKEFVFALFPQIVGLQIFIAGGKNNDTLIAYMNVEQIGFPQLSEFVLQEKITARELKVICAYKAMQPQTTKELLDEVFALCSTASEHA